jgi:hypothetical protein
MHTNMAILFSFCQMLAIENLPKKKTMFFLGFFLFVAKVMTITTRLILPNLAIN